MPVSGIYCEGYIENYRNVQGFLATYAFKNVLGETIWWNNLANILIRRKYLPPDYPIPSVFDKPDKLRILHMEKTFSMARRPS